MIEVDYAHYVDHELPESLSHWLDTVEPMPEEMRLKALIAQSALNVLRSEDDGNRRPIWTFEKAIDRLKKLASSFTELGISKAPTEFLKDSTRQVILELKERNLIGGFEGVLPNLENMDTVQFTVFRWNREELGKYASYLGSVAAKKAIERRK